VHLGAREVERLGDLRHGGLGQMPECGVQSAQHRQQRALEGTLVLDDRGGLGRVPSHGARVS